MISKQVVSVILGGGAGTRLFPLTATRSKPAVPIAGKYRLVDIPISNCINSGINRMFVLTQFNSASLNKHIKNTYQFSAFSKGFVDILAAEQTPDSPGWFQGTADAVRQSLKHIDKNEFEYALILSGDQLYQMDFGTMLKHHQESGASITIATIPVAAKEATEFGILKTNDQHQITSFIEKPAADVLAEWVSDTGAEMKSQERNYLASMGIYIFNRQVLFDLLESEKKSATDFGKEIIPYSIHQYPVSSYQFEGYWTDIGNIHSFFEANLALTMDIPPFNMFDNDNMVYSRARMLPPSKISGTQIEQSIISDGCIVHAASLVHSVVGVRSRIGNGSHISGCYVMGNDYYETLSQLEDCVRQGIPRMGIGDDCNLKNVIVDKDARIGNQVTIVGGSHLKNTDQPNYSIKDGIVVIKKRAIIADGFELK